ncbi:unnamed protein product [Musa textilis]
MASTGRTDKRQVADLHKYFKDPSVPPAFSLASELSSFSTTVLSLRAPSPSPLVACKWKPLAADSESLETEETPVVVPEPYIVFRGRFIYTQRLKGANVDDKVRGIFIGDLLLVGTRTKAYIGQPAVTNAAVHAVFEEQGLDCKVIVFKYKKKKNYHHTIGHRQIPHCTTIAWITITGITGHQDFPAETMPETSPA